MRAVRHTDADREYAYDRDPILGSGTEKLLSAATDHEWTVIDMAVDWEPDHIAWYIDGVKCAQFTDAAHIENGPMQIILHMMVDNDWQRQWNVGLTNPTLSRQLEVDYLRVYQQRPAS